MDRDKIMRAALLTTVPFNVLGAALFAFPESRLGQSVGLPAPVPAIYSAILAFFVVLFGAGYLWMGCQRVIARPLVTLLAFGKTGVFLIILIFWLMGTLRGSAVVVALGDLAFAVIFFWWLCGTRIPPKES